MMNGSKVGMAYYPLRMMGFFAIIIQYVNVIKIKEYDKINKKEM